MKKSFFAVVAAGACATALLVGCGDSSSSPSKSRVQKCANGLTDECLIGTWNLNGLADLATPTRDIRTPDFDYQANPGKLVFKADGTLEFTFPANAPADLMADSDCQSIKGSWSIEAGALKVRNVTQNFDNLQMCVLENIFVKKSMHSAGSITVVPEISSEGAVVKMVIPQLLMMGGKSVATDDVAFYNSTGEVYTCK